MFFRRQSNDGAQWVAVAHEGREVTAVAVSHTDAQRTRVDWLWHAAADTLTDSLRLLGRTPQWSGQRLLGVMPRANYKVVATEAPDVPREDWRDALRWSLRDHIDFPIDDALIDVLAVPQDTSARQTNPVFAVALARSAYSEAELACDDMGHQWAALDVVETGLRNISALAERDGLAHALMAFGQDHGVLVITFKGELIMSRQIDVPVASLTGDASARDAALNRVALEVVRTIDTFERMHSQLSLSELSVLTPSHLGDEVITLLSEQVYIPVKPCDLGNWFELGALGDEGQRLARHASLNEAAALGACLREHPSLADKQHLDLLDKNSVLTRDPSWSARLGVKLAAGVLAVCMVAGVTLSVLLARSQSQTVAIEQELPALQQSMSVQQEPAVLKELQEMQLKQTTQREMLDALQANMSGASMGYSGFLRALGRQAQSSLWITGLTVLGDGQDMEIRGRMLTAAVLPPYLQSLQRESLFAGRRFAQLEVKAVQASEGGEASLTEFILRTRPAGNAPASAASGASRSEALAKATQEGKP